MSNTDNTGMEVDAIVETDDGRWIAFEIKLGVGKVEENAGLLKFARRWTPPSSRPSALAIVGRATAMCARMALR